MKKGLSKKTRMAGFFFYIFSCSRDIQVLVQKLMTQTQCMASKQQTETHFDVAMVLLSAPDPLL